MYGVLPPPFHLRRMFKHFSAFLVAMIRWAATLRAQHWPAALSRRIYSARTSAPRAMRLRAPRFDYILMSGKCRDIKNYLLSIIDTDGILLSRQYLPALSFSRFSHARIIYLCRRCRFRVGWAYHLRFFGLSALLVRASDTAAGIERDSVIHAHNA